MRTDRKVTLFLGALLLSYQLLALGGHQYSIDGALTFQAARVLLAEKTLHFDPPLRWGNKYYWTSKYGIGMTIAYIPFLAIVQLFRPDLIHMQFDSKLPYDWNLMRNDLYLYCSSVNPIIVVVTGILLYQLALKTGLSRKWSLVTSLVACLASPYSVYGRYDFAQPFVGLIVVVAILLIRRASESESVLQWFYPGLAIAYGVSIRPDFVMFVPWFLLLGYWMRRSSVFKNLLVMCLPMIFSGIVILMFNYHKFGSFLNFGEEIIKARPSLRRLIGLLVSPGRGIFFFFPLVCLTVSGLLSLAKKRKWEAMAFAGIFLTQLFFYSLWHGAFGGWCWGPRFLIPVIPLLVLCCIHSAAEHYSNPARRTLFVGLVVLSWFLTVNGILFDFVPFYGRFYEGWGALKGTKEHFLMRASPIMSGWSFSPSVANYDLFFLKQIAAKNIAAIATTFSLLTILIASACRLPYLLKESEAK
ncbi:hypothetical protein L0222_19320 [bacterium]|nr:hypothetical protein [bacterium]MCI0605096.1 hypothetical protein [bacterium]